MKNRLTTYAAAFALAVTGLVWSGTAFAQPPNDECADAEVIGLGLTAGTLVDATATVSPTCVTNIAEVWYSWTPAFSGTAVIEMCADGDAFDSILAVYDSCGGTQLACNDDASPPLPCDFAFNSRITLPVTAGETYKILAGALSGTGTFALTVDLESIDPEELEVYAPFPGGEGGLPDNPSGGGGAVQIGDGGGDGNHVHIVAITNTGVDPVTLLGMQVVVADGPGGPINWDEVAPFLNRNNQPSFASPIELQPGERFPAFAETTGSFAGGTLSVRYGLAGLGGVDVVEESVTIAAPSGDTDGDGVFDSYELYLGRDPDVAQPAGTDTDGNGLSDLIEQALLTDGLNPADPPVIAAGFNFLQTTNDIELDFTLLGGLPPDFFGPGSDPFAGTVNLTAAPLGTFPGCSDEELGNANLVLERMMPAPLVDVPQTTAIPVEIAALSLVSIAPITVTYADTSTIDFDVTVGLSTVEESGGTLTLNQLTGAGGNFTAELEWAPVLVFTEVGNPANSFELDIAVALTQKVPLSTDVNVGAALWDRFNPAVVCPDCSTSLFLGTRNLEAAPFQLGADGSPFTFDVEPACVEGATVEGDVLAGEQLLTTKSGISVVFGVGDVPALPLTDFDAGADPDALFIAEVELFPAAFPQDGVVLPACGGADIGSTNLVIRQAGPAMVAGIGDIDTVPIEVSQFAARTAEPVEVAGTSWNITLGLDRIGGVSQSAGSLTITRTSESGGVADYEIFLRPTFLFQEVGNPGNLFVRSLPSAIRLVAKDVPWTSNRALVGWPECTPNFVPDVLPGDVFLQGRGVTLTAQPTILLPPFEATSVVPSTLGPTNANTVSFEVTFTEPAFNITDLGDFVVIETGSVTRTAPPAFEAVNPVSPGVSATWRVFLNGIVGSGTIALKANTESDITNALGQPLLASVTSEPVVIDNEPPVITLLGDAAVTVEFGDAFTDPGAEATDNIDGDLTAAIVVTGAVDVNTLGVYELRYNVSDEAGNAAAEVVRTVTVVDTTPPAITLLGDAAVTVEAGTAFTDPGATATDNVDGDLTGSIVVTGAVDTDTLGVYELRYNVSDSSGNAADEVVRTVTVADTTPPVITLLGDAFISVPQGDTFTDPGATAEDSFEGDLTGDIVVTGAVDTATAGFYLLRYNVSDSSGNAAAEVTRTVQVVAPVLPSITLIGAAAVTVEAGTSFTDPGATAQDGDGNDLTGSIVVTGAVNVNALGVYTLSYDVVDGDGNAAPTVTRTVTVADTIPPVITLLGDAEITIELGDTFTDPGATAADSFEGDLTGSIVVTGTVDTSTEGVYVLRYNVSDSSGNAAAEVTRTVTVEETTLPQDINGDGVVNAVDVQLVINAALGIAIDPAFNPDVNRDGAVNAVDVQLVINAALGIL